MRRTSSIPPGCKPDPRAGYSVLEMLCVLVLIALACAIVFPRGAAMTDRVVAHAVFFDFQRQVSDLRREAYLSQSPVTIRSADDADPVDARARVILLRAGWSYRLDRPLAISDGGACPAATVRILNQGRLVMNLRTVDDACRFSRLD